jgi:c-di-GMP-binding flagellar brake protein YcgR
VSASSPEHDDRREFPRVDAPMYCRPARRRLLRRRKVVDVGLGGMRVYSDDPFVAGDRLEIDLLSGDGEDFVTCLTEVVWIRELEAGKPARYDVGLRFLEIPTAARAMLEDLVAKALARNQPSASFPGRR